MKLTESILRKIIRNILLEKKEVNHEFAFTNAVDLDGDGKDDVSLGACSIEGIKQGGTHSFHGNYMYPCKPSEGGGSDGDFMVYDGTTGTGQGGPFLGWGTPNSDNIKDAIEYLDAFTPEKLVAYSRGGAMAQHARSSLPSDVDYVAPAFSRTYGIESEDVQGSGRIYHGGKDQFVPLKNSVVASLSSGMPLYVKPGKSHGGILWDYKSGDMSGYKELSDALKQRALEELPHWGNTTYLTKRDKEVIEQDQWVIDNLIEAVIRRVLEEAKKKPKCPRKNGKRDYKCEYREYGGASKKGKKDRAARNQARKVAEREGRVKKGDGKEIDHKKPLSKGGSNAKSNQRVVSRTTNRKKGNK